MMKNVMGPAAEAEPVSILHHGQEDKPTCTTLNVMFHPQPATLTKKENSTANSIVNNNLHPKCSKATCMGFIESRIKSIKTISIYYGIEAQNNLEVTSSRITHQIITYKCGQYTYTLKPSQRNILQGGGGVTCSYRTARLLW